ncbi:hypothetical protein NQ318_008035 [Aromia moschata]|uniref:Uncharacterized protein n=1 Tax=Aromia moschata TaxID=1265417 RepID=A0AAV8XWB8_9CUCU|nr:hypothetical protein NQ318_008035 [Aromia moschata]
MVANDYPNAKLHKNVFFYNYKLSFNAERTDCFAGYMGIRFYNRNDSEMVFINLKLLLVYLMKYTYFAICYQGRSTGVRFMRNSQQWWSVEFHMFVFSLVKVPANDLN